MSASQGTPHQTWQRKQLIVHIGEKGRQACLLDARDHLTHKGIGDLSDTPADAAHIIAYIQAH